MTADRIWFTFKARIRAQIRLSKNDFHSQALLVWYAFCGAALAVLVIRYGTILGGNTDLLAAVFSVAILVVSLMVTGRDFRGRSIEMQRNYLALQSLYRRAIQTPTALTDAEIEEEYDRLLESGENHGTLDDICARVFHTGELTSRAPTKFESARAYAYVVVRTATTFFLYTLPVAVGLYAFYTKH
ncbi:SLATT domain-containing protein [Paraburkholderia sediminicola]|uniref:SLATT domain-containing protein n=1 Tax=Paraburkholderia rhynchosiae TaxID=487049 RepID=A0ACC7NNX0_9BURK